jgi:hypothetical protein
VGTRPALGMVKKKIFSSVTNQSLVIMANTVTILTKLHTNN